RLGGRGRRTASGSGRLDSDRDHLALADGPGRVRCVVATGKHAIANDRVLTAREYQRGGGERRANFIRVETEDVVFRSPAFHGGRLVKKWLPPGGNTRRTNQRARHREWVEACAAIPFDLRPFHRNRPPRKWSRARVGRAGRSR